MSANQRKQSLQWMPNFCDTFRLFLSIVVVQIVVFVYSLSFFEPNLTYLKKLSYLTLFSQFICLVIILSFCKLRPILNHFRAIHGIVLVVVIVLAISFSIATLVNWLDIRLLSEFLSNQGRDPYLTFKLVAMSLLLSLAMIRYFYIQDQWEVQVKELSNARLKSLQARIKPHFLFNTLNSIASLITVDPEKAEKAVVDFSSLMRRTFQKHKKVVTLEEELKFVKQYLAIETLRLGSRLSFQLECPQDALKFKVPVLSLQPLVENAVAHGIQHLPNGGEIVLSVVLHSSKMVIQVSNPYLKGKSEPMNGMALENIRQRLHLIYSGRAELKVQSEDEQFDVILKIPL